MNEKYGLEILIKHIEMERTLLLIKKEHYMSPDFVMYILNTLKEIGVAETLHYAEDLSFTTFKKEGEFTIVIEVQLVSDEIVVNALHTAVARYLQNKPLPKSTSGPLPSKQKDKTWKFNLSQDSISFLNTLGDKTPVKKIHESEVGNGSPLFNFPSEAPEYIRGVHVCPHMSLETCSDVFLEMYKDYLAAVAIQTAGGKVEDPNILRGALNEVLNMMAEFQKYTIDCGQCSIKEQCDFYNLDDDDED